MSVTYTKSLTNRLFTTRFVWSKNKRNITYPNYWVFAIGITDYSTLCQKISPGLQQRKLPNPLTVDVVSWGHLYIYIYIYIYMIAHRLFFLRDTCWSVQLWICTNILELYDFNMASVYIYIYQDITKIGTWVCNLRNCVFRHCYNSNITWAS